MQDGALGLFSQPHPALPLYACENADSNELRRVEGLSSNPHLRVLSLARNRISELSSMEHLRALRELYLSTQGVSQQRMSWGKRALSIWPP
jgi:Leucine-rich repeat (LRR) protein